jgi:cell division inhibitor SulA
LAAFNTKAAKKAAHTAIFNSLFARPELQEWAKKVRTATHEKMIEALKTNEADTAIAYLVEWIGNKEKAKEAAAAKETGGGIE